MIETHAHLNTEAFNEDIETVIQNAKLNNIEKIIVIGMDEESNKRAIELADAHDFIYAACGIHPSYVDNGVVSSIEKYLTHPKVVAVGECGIDLYWQNDNLGKQIEYFTAQIELAIKYNLPLIIHTRNSFNEAYQVLEPFFGKVNGVFHCFSSNYDDALKIIEKGFLIGIDGPVTFKKAVEIHEIVEKINLKNILIETDSPYMAPAPYRGKRNEPMYLKYIAEKIAEIKNISLTDVEQITSENALKLFKKLGGLK